MPISTLKGYTRIGGVIGYGPVGGSGVWKLQERYALADDFYDDVSLLLKMNGANGSTTFLDSSQFGHTVTANGNAAISTAQSKFGGSSAYFDGTGDYLTVPDSSQFEFGSGDFTIELWFYIAGNSSQNNNGQRVANLVTKLPVSGTIVGFDVYINGNSTTTGTGLAFTNYNVSTVFSCSYTGSITQSAWHHAAVCRNGSNLHLFLDGTEVDLETGISGSVQDTAHSVMIGRGAFTNYQSPFNGYIDSLRITKGQARYTAAFTPPQRDFLP